MTAVLTTPFWPSHPAGSEAHRLAGVWWLLLGLGTFVAVVVLTAVMIAMFRRRTEGSPSELAVTHHRFIIGGGLIFPVIILSIVAAVTVDTTANLRRTSSDDLAINVTAEQWFWRIAYADSGVVTANELRLPVNRPVGLKMFSDNVIHSFWVPQLAGKLDVIPGQSPVLTFTPEKVGTFRGECAEFCGLQHANMNFVVDVMPADAFDSWIRAHQAPPPPPTDPLAQQGRNDFVNLPCAGCHTIRGLTNGTVGPDLTDIGERSTLGSATVPNNDANLTIWMGDAQLIKPGAKMPPIDLTADQTAALVAYLRTLR